MALEDTQVFRQVTSNAHISINSKLNIIRELRMVYEFLVTNHMFMREDANLEDAFGWGATTQGYEYWDHVNINLQALPKKEKKYAAIYD